MSETRPHQQRSTVELDSDSREAGSADLVSQSDDSLPNYLGGYRIAPPVSLAEPPAADDLLGARISKYSIEKKLGAGGMGVVYQAIEMDLGRKVAIKFLHHEKHEKAGAHALLAEARTAAFLKHEHFVHVYTFDSLANGQPYLVMEYLEGTTLRNWLQTLRSVPEILKIFMQILAGMAVAHSRSIVHRDLKPDNIFVTSDGNVKIFDLGLAGLMGPAISTTMKRAQLPELAAERSGTPQYIAPEVWRKGTPTAQLDVWAIGIMLYQALSGGQHPFWNSADPLEVNAFRVAHGAYPSLSAQRHEISPELDRIIEKALARELVQRYADAGALRDAIRVFLSAAGGSAPAPPRSKPTSTHALARSSKLARFWLLGGPILGVLIAGGSVARKYLPGRTVPPRSGMAELAGGQFIMGSTASDMDSAVRWCEEENQEPLFCSRGHVEREQPQHAVTLAPFYLDRTEVTTQSFAAWLNEEAAKGRIHVSGDGRRVSTRGSGPAVLLTDLYPSYNPPHGLIFVDDRFQPSPGFGNMPISQVTWEAARRYCQAQGKRLPTEAEWEYAARGGGIKGFRFPWGNSDPTCRGVVAARGEAELPGNALSPPPRVRLRCFDVGIGPAPVGTSMQDISPQGIYDLGGNVSEWVQDPFVDRYPPCGKCINPVTPEEALVAGAPRRVFRGGSWSLLLAHTRAAARSRFDPRAAPRDVGFRCAKDQK